MDSREINHRWFESFSEERMIFTVCLDGEMEIDIPAKFELCNTCEGKGKMVNPSIDSHGLSAEDFDDDPDFRENYFSGMYDIPCNECGGRRVSAEPDYERMPKDLAEQVESFIVDYYQYESCCRKEREMGY